MIKRHTLFSMLGLVVVLAACTNGRQDPATTADPAPDSGSLHGVCPDPVVVQTAWTPSAEHGALYNLLGDDYEVDADQKRVSGTLTAGGRDTGVQLEIRVGGPAVGYQSAAALMQQDPSITLGQVATDDAISMSAKAPVVAVVAPFEISPYMIMWDPQVHPEFNTLNDIGLTDTKVLYFESATYMKYLTGSGILREGQVDGSYDGSPANFVASGGTIAQQGFATNEPYLYKNLPQWGKEVKFELIHDSGYPIYPEAIVVRADKQDELSACLEQLVPIIQQSQIDYITKSKPTNQLIVELVEQYGGFPYSLEQAAFSVDQQRKLGIVSNGPDDTLGNFDMDRVRKVIDIVEPIFAGQNLGLPADLTPQKLVTNEFIDPAIHLSPDA